MKKICSLLLALLLCLLSVPALADTWYCPSCGRLNNANFCPVDGTAKPRDMGSSSSYTNNQDRLSSLSPSNECIVQPTIYTCHRYYDNNRGKAYDLNEKFSVKKIRNNQRSRTYGLYMKFTPSRVDNGYHIHRFDVVISSPSGVSLYTTGFDTDMTCEYGRYWYWDFFSLEEFFAYSLQNYNNIPSGTYRIDIYFNSLWAGKSIFKVTN